MRKVVLLISFVQLGLCYAFSQNNPGTSFDGRSTGDVNICPGSLNALTDSDISTMITEMLRRYGLKNRYILVPCAQIDNCQAAVYDGKPYILYNASYLNSVKRLNFSETIIPAKKNDWEALTILAHELGHHLNLHLSNAPKDMTNIEKEIEADEVAGFIIFLMGGSKEQAQSAFSNVPEKTGITHPGRSERFAAVEKGWNEARDKYGNERTSFQDYEGQIYKTVKIGTQLWASENLNTTRFRNGEIIPEAKTPEEWMAAGQQGKPAWCYYENNPMNAQKYGKLYNWYAVNDPRGLAPFGTHIPSENEWAMLVTFLGGTDVAGGKIKTNLWNVPNSGATNSSGFNGVPGGYRYGDGGGISHMGNIGQWWTINSYDNNNALNFYAVFNEAFLARSANLKSNGFSVRCIKD